MNHGTFTLLLLLFNITYMLLTRSSFHAINAEVLTGGPGFSFYFDSNRRDILVATSSFVAATDDLFPLSSFTIDFHLMVHEIRDQEIFSYFSSSVSRPSNATSKPDYEKLSVFLDDIGRIGIARYRYNNTHVDSFRSAKQAAPISSTYICLSSSCNIRKDTWTHVSIGWDPTSKAIKFWINGIPQDFGDAYSRSFSLRIASKNNTCTTQGGYETTSKPCVLPFTVAGNLYTGCAPFNESLGAMPYIDPLKPTPSGNYSFWCPTTPRYSTTEPVIRKMWTFCTCKNYQGDSVKYGLPEAYSTQQRVLQGNLFPIDLIIDQHEYELKRVAENLIPPTFSSNSMALTILSTNIANSASLLIEIYKIAKSLEMAGAAAVMISTNINNFRRIESLLNNQAIASKESISKQQYRSVSQNSLFLQYPYRGDVDINDGNQNATGDAIADSCILNSDASNLFDFDHSTYWSGIVSVDRSISYKYRSSAFSNSSTQSSTQVFKKATYYSIVPFDLTPSNSTIWPLSWSIYFRSVENDTWVLVHSYSRSTDPSRNVVWLQHLIRLPVLQFSYDAFKVEFLEFEFAINNTKATNGLFRISEIGIFNFPNSNEAIELSSLYTLPIFTDTGVSSAGAMSIPVILVSDGLNTWVNSVLYDNRNISAFNMYLTTQRSISGIDGSESLFYQPLSKRGIIIFGQDVTVFQRPLYFNTDKYLSESLKTDKRIVFVDDTRKFSGLIDSFRVFEYMRTDSQAKAMYQSEAPYESEIFYAFNDIICDFDLDSIQPALPERSDCKTNSQQSPDTGPNALGYLYIGRYPDSDFMTYDKYPYQRSPTRPRLVPSSANGFGSGEIIVTLDPSTSKGKTVEITLVGIVTESEPLFDLSTFSITQYPKNGTLSAIRNPSDHIKSTIGGAFATINYTLSSNSVNWRNDSFAFTISLQRSSKRDNMEEYACKVFLLSPSVFFPVTWPNSIANSDRIYLAENESIAFDFSTLNPSDKTNANTLNLKIKRLPKFGSLVNVYEDTWSGESTTCNSSVLVSDKTLQSESLKYIAPSNLPPGGELDSFTYYFYDPISKWQSKVATVEFNLLGARKSLQSGVNYKDIYAKPIGYVELKNATNSQYMQHLNLTADVLERGSLSMEFSVWITRLPQFGYLHRIDSELGSYYKEREIVSDYELKLKANEVLRYSSKRVTTRSKSDDLHANENCLRECMNYNSLDCTGLCSQGNVDQLLSNNEVYPRSVYQAGDSVFAFSEFTDDMDISEEFIEIKIPEAIHIGRINIYEVSDPGAIKQISIPQYSYSSQDLLQRCVMGIDPQVSNKRIPLNCTSGATAWDVLFSRTVEEMKFEKYKNQERQPQVFSPIFCPSQAKVDTIRLDLRINEDYKNYAIDSIVVNGQRSLPGLIAWSRNQTIEVAYDPITGIHGFDSFSIELDDCYGSSNPFPVHPEVPAPPYGNIRKGFAILPNQMIPLKVSLSQGEYVANTSIVFHPLVFDYQPVIDFLDSYIKLNPLAYAEHKLVWIGDENGEISSQSILNPGNQIITITANDILSKRPVKQIVGIDMEYLGNHSTTHIEQWVTVLSTSSDSFLNVTFRLFHPILQGCLANQFGMCASERPILKGSCSKLTTGRMSNSIDFYKCTCGLPTDKYSDWMNGDSCEYTMWETCMGRGYPRIDGTCDCFNKTIHGGSTCTKRRSPATSIESIEDEMKTLGKRLAETFEFDDSNFVVSVNDATNRVHLFLNPNLNSVASQRRLLAVESSNEINPSGQRFLANNETIPRNITADLLAQGYIIMTSISIDSEYHDSCNGRGKPTSEGECICEDSYFGPSCEYILVCEAGEYLFIRNATSNSVDARDCLPCEPGYACPDGVLKKLCPVGTLAPGNRSLTCYESCNDVGKPGHYIVVNNNTFPRTSCSPCKAGNECPDGKAQNPCPFGSFAPVGLMINCISCSDIGISFYADEIGSTSCKSCPAHTFRLSGTDGESVEECICEKGYWTGPAFLNKTGVECLPCLANAECDGHYIISSSSTNDTFTYGNANPYPKVGAWGDPAHPTQFFYCEEDACLGGHDFKCYPGYTGVFCQQCADGYFSVGDSCTKCPDREYRTAFTFFTIAGIVIAFALINLASDTVPALDICLLYTQIISIIQQFSMYWPSPVNILNTPFQVTDFDIDFISPQCSVPWDYAVHFIIQFFVPWFLLMLFLLLNGFNYAGFRYIQYRKSKMRVNDDVQNNDTPAQNTKANSSGKAPTSPLMRLRTPSSASNQNVLSEKELAEDPRWTYIRESLLGLVSFPQTREEYDTYTNRQIAGLFNFFRIVYNTLVVVCLETFFCTKLANGVSVVSAASDVICYSSTHVNAMLIWGAIGVVIYVVGIPFFFVFLLNRAEQMGTKTDKIFIERWSFLYRNYKSSYHKWEAMLLFRRFAMASVLVLFKDDAIVQAVIGGSVILFCLVMHISNRPFLNKRLNILETASLSSCLIYILCGVAFTSAYNNPDIDGLDGSVYGLSTFLLVISLMNLIFAFSIFAYDLRGYSNVLIAEKRLYKRALHEDVALIRAVRRLNKGDFGDIEREYLALRKPKEQKQDRFQKFKNYAFSSKTRSSMGSSEDAESATTPAMQTSKMQSGRTLGTETGKRTHRSTPSGTSATFLDTTPGRDGNKSIFDPVFPSLRQATTVLSTSAKKQKDEQSIFFNIDIDGSGAITLEEFVEYAKQNLGLKSAGAEETIIKNLFSKYDINSGGEIDFNEFQELIKGQFPDLKKSELKNTIKARYLSKWTKKNPSALLVALFFDLDELLRNVVSDESPLSEYRETKISKFFRRLVESFPIILDWAASADPDDVIAFRRILTQFQAAEDDVGLDGSLSRMSVSIDRAPLVHWLIYQAKEEDRLVYKTIMGSIARESRLQVWEPIKRGKHRRLSSTESSIAVNLKSVLEEERNQQNFYSPSSSFDFDIATTLSQSVSLPNNENESKERETLTENNNAMMHSELLIQNPTVVEEEERSASLEETNTIEYGLDPTNKNAEQIQLPSPPLSPSITITSREIGATSQKTIMDENDPNISKDHNNQVDEFLLEDGN